MPVPVPRFRAVQTVHVQAQEAAIGGSPAEQPPSSSLHPLVELFTRSVARSRRERVREAERLMTARSYRPSAERDAVTG